MPNFRPVLNSRYWWGWGDLLLLLAVVFTGGKQSQLLDLSLGLGLEFDANNLFEKVF